MPSPPSTNASSQQSLQERLRFLHATTPHVVADPGETEEGFLARRRAIDALSPEKRALLTDDRWQRVIATFVQRFALSLDAAAAIARAVRDVILNRLPLDDLDRTIATTAPQIAPMMRTEIVRTLQHMLLRGAQDAAPQEVRLPLREALARYPQIAQQVITTAAIPLHKGRTAVAGTVRHWLDDYLLAVGSGAHTAIHRGKYLFHNTNTRALSAADRHHVALILKSYDEDLPLTIDPERKAIRFPSAPPLPSPMHPGADRATLKPTAPPQDAQAE